MGRILSGSDWEGLKGRGSLSWGDFLLLQARGPHNRDVVSSEGPGLCASPVLAISPKGPPVMDPSHFLGSKLAHMWGEHSEAQSLAELLETWGPPGLSEPGSHPQGMGTLHWAIMAPQGTSAGDTLLPSPYLAAEPLKRLFLTMPAHTLLPLPRILETSVLPRHSLSYARVLSSHCSTGL